jgi:Animal haem peroxidase
MSTRSRPAVARDHCLAPGRPTGAPVYGGRYARLLPELQSLFGDEQLLHTFGAAHGVCDAGDNCPDARVAAGWPFVGQFVAHDITADRSPLVSRADPAGVRNYRTPAANLECLYGGGPVGSPYLYDRDDPAVLLTGEHAGDVPRNAQGIALIGDPRNDVHLFVNQLHVALIHAHNLLVQRLREDGEPEAQVFDEARRALTWHYQWVVLNDFLPVLIGEELSARLLEEGPTVYQPGDAPQIPLEFADGAYRYGHSQIRDRYLINESTAPLPLFPELIGFEPVPPEHVISWSMLFDVPGEPPAQRAKQIDGRLPESLIRLPVAITGSVEEEAFHSLAARDLQRGQATGLPSGEAVAGALGLEPLSSEEVGLAERGWDAETPLWYYVLREADVQQRGDRLGAVGGRIVGEVLVGIIDADPDSYRAVDRTWRPTLPAAAPGSYGIADLIRATALANA